MSRNVNLCNLGNVLQRNFKTDRTRECIFRASGSTNFEKLTAWRQTWWRLRECAGLPKKNLDTLLSPSSNLNIKNQAMFDDLENNLYVLAKSRENTVIPSREVIMCDTLYQPKLTKTFFNAMYYEI